MTLTRDLGLLTVQTALHEGLPLPPVLAPPAGIAGLGRPLFLFLFLPLARTAVLGVGFFPQPENTKGGKGGDTNHEKDIQKQNKKNKTKQHR